MCPSIALFCRGSRRRVIGLVFFVLELLSTEVATEIAWSVLCLFLGCQ
jgi:hypothetical protein